MGSHSLRDSEICDLLHQYDSEDGLEGDDDSVIDPDFQPLSEDLELFSDCEENTGVDIDAIIEESERSETIAGSSSADPGQQDSQSNKASTNQKRQKRQLQWKKKNLVLSDQQLQFTGNTTLPPNLLELDTPIQFFFYLFPKELISFITEQTNLYIIQKNPNQSFQITDTDIQQFIGATYMMSLIQLPRVTSHWNTSIGTPMIQEIMPKQKFEKIRQYIHFNDNSNLPSRNATNGDRLFKIRPIIENLNRTFSGVPLERYLCVDEQICSTKARSNLKRYNPKKPHKWGYKIFVLSGVSGFAYKIELETGAENIVLPAEPDLGPSSNVVVRMARVIPRHQNYQLYFDNYFTSLALLEYLGKEGILSLGTVRRNRIPDCKLPADKEVMKKERGFSVEYVTNMGGIDVSNVIWKDNKVVTLVSSFAGELPKAQVRRYDKANKKYINIDRPHIVGEYNRHMGGVDLIDSIMGRYKILTRSKRWQVRMFYHFLDLTMANSWLLYRRVRQAKNCSDKQMSSADFRLDIGETLCKLGLKPNVRHRRSIECEIQAKKHKGPAQHVPPMAVRQDQIGHWPIWVEKRVRCKFPKCTGVSQTICEKCGVVLCYNKQNNCFRSFHTK
ncbi:piggyBac transposable element-derived protein 2-like [Melitaea cinxia]|uniref:piggyBac transposable element-derived protein 2-like n=1 Tax=Melitaea cinxia TaxID=113334 RepID=UPI001E2706A2|nr:piggyBac transposable element-derived protein 2-like [Melitaea cinxia]